MDNTQLNQLHPRPQFIREGWELLDGTWKFAFDDEQTGVKKNWGAGIEATHDILVPFTYETKLSGINDPTHHHVVWYERTINVTSDKNVLLHFEGVDYNCTLWVNGKLVGHHEGGYHAFKFDITDYVTQGDNTIVLKVEDYMDPTQPRGKQRWREDNWGCWYVQTTGIWKSVWLEYVAPTHIDYVKMTPVFDSQRIDFEVELNKFQFENYEVRADITFNGEAINTVVAKFSADVAKFSSSVLVKGDPWSMKQWSPHEPNLYDVTFRIIKSGEVIDELKSYFGMRQIAIQGQKILLNGVELYQRSILDQGYWDESELTPPSVEALEKDIDLMLEMGYNSVRKHQKIEDNRFLYLCDKKGMLVWSEFPAAYTFSDKAIERTTVEWMKLVKQHYNHPSIITWVPFNESWGVSDILNDKKQQQFTEGVYYLTKSFDQMRPVVSNDGWEHTITDIVTLHDYEELGTIIKGRYEDQDKLLSNGIQHNGHRHPFANGYTYNGQPVIMSEFGGIAFKTEDGWGYGNQVASHEDFVERFDNVHQAIQDLEYISGFCYTQLTDVQQELNGLLTINREPKVDLKEVHRVNTRRQK